MDAILTKTCTMCGEVKPLSAFRARSRNRDGRTCECAECYRRRDRELYARSPNRRKTIRDRADLVRDQSRRLVREYLATHPCVDCGESDVQVLEFDHRGEDPKLFDISKAVLSGFASGSIFSEIAKCDVRCANCHRRKTRRTLGWL